MDELFDDMPCPGGSCTVSAGTPIPVTAGAAAPAIDFALGAAGAIAGSLRAESTGAALTGACVDILDAAGQRVTCAPSDSSGNYHAGGLPAGIYYARSYNPDGYIDELYRDVPCSLGACPLAQGSPITVTAGHVVQGIDFALARGGAISGSVRAEGADGVPIAGGCVEIFDAQGRLLGCGSPNGLGRYVVDGLLPGAYYARTLNGSGYVDELFDALPCTGRWCDPSTGTPIQVTAGATRSNVDFVLALGGRVGGHLKDARSAQPIEGAVVRVYDAAGRPVSDIYSDASGSYLSYGLPAGTYRAATWNQKSYTDELFDDIPCPRGVCEISSGTPILVTAGTTTAADFALLRQPLGFYTVPACRVLDSRDVQSQWGGEPLHSDTLPRSIAVTGHCGVPASAQAVAVNVTVTRPTASGYVTVYPGGLWAPKTSTVNHAAGQTRAGHAIMELGPGGVLAVSPGLPAGASVHVVVDVVGYFE